VQKNRKTGLPDVIDMRHDRHFVDLISSRVTGPQIRMIPLSKIDPNPRQARSELGDIKELMDSIKSKGILEPILVRPKEGRYEIIAGERRFIASKNLRLKEIPCIEMNVDDNEAMELTLIENLQRKDLDAFEEADGLCSLADNYGYSHEEISKKIGKARSTVTEMISISKIPDEVREFCKEFDIMSRSTLVEISKQKRKDDMIKLLYEIKNRELRREDTRELSKKLSGKVKKISHFVYNYTPMSDFYKLRIEFKKQSVTKDEIIQILESIIKKLKKNK
jgi:ParB family chromosome partitioning protein